MLPVFLSYLSMIGWFRLYFPVQTAPPPTICLLCAHPGPPLTSVLGLLIMCAKVLSKLAQY